MKKFRGYIYTSLSFIFLILPNVIWFTHKREAYFKADSGKLAVGAIITLLFILSLLRGALNDVDKRFATLFSLLTIWAIVWFFESIIHDLFWILACGVVGYVMYLGLSVIGKRDIEYYKQYRYEKARIQARNDAQQEFNSGGV